MARASIGLPVYNGERFLREAIESALAQTFSDFELIISDNASTDRTGEICREYAERDPRIRYTRNETNRGVAWNFNRVIELSTGDYFKFLAADDGMEPGFLERTIELLDRDPDLVLACSHYLNRDEESDHTRLEDSDLGLPQDRPHERFRRYLFEHQVSKAPMHGLIRTSVLKRTRLLRPFIGADDCLTIDLLLRGRFAYIPECLFRIRTHPDASHRLRFRQGGREGVAEMRYYDPRTTGKVYLPYWRRLGEYGRLVLTANAGPGEKLRMTGTLLHYFATTKYTWLASDLLFALGLGPSYRRAKEFLRRAYSRVVHPGSSAA